jgi:adenine/guanine phosphoribosyltransferase-like PRPP-binding protein
MKELIKCFHNKSIVKLRRTNYIVNPITDHYPETNYDLIKDIVKELSKLTDFSKANKIVGEEDRGGYIAGFMALKKKKALAMVKWNPIGIEGEIKINFRNSYTNGKMYLHGVKKGDKIILVEDLIDSGGTIIAMIKLLRKAKINIIDVICVGTKKETGGLERIKKETGVDVKYLIKFSCKGKTSKVIEIKGRKANFK